MYVHQTKLENVTEYSKKYYLYRTYANIYFMGNKALKIFYAVFMALMLVALTVFMIIHIRAGIDGTNAKILLAGYVLLIIWAAGRLFTLVKSLKK